MVSDDDDGQMIPVDECGPNFLTFVRDLAPGIFSDLLRSVQMLKREWDAESNGKLSHILNP